MSLGHLLTSENHCTLFTGLLAAAEAAGRPDVELDEEEEELDEEETFKADLLIVVGATSHDCDMSRGSIGWKGGEVEGEAGDVGWTVAEE